MPIDRHNLSYSAIALLPEGFSTVTPSPLIRHHGCPSRLITSRIGMVRHAVQRASQG